MTYGYVKGGERTALTYYQSLLPQVEDSQERVRIDQVIQDLSEIITYERVQFHRDRGDAEQISNRSNLSVSMAHVDRDF
jgi:hypothetical protein